MDRRFLWTGQDRAGILPICPTTEKDRALFKKNTILIILCAVIVAAAAGWFYYAQSDDGIWADPSNPELVMIGQGAYAARCASCHGKNLQGEPNWRQRRPDKTLPAPPHDRTGHSWHHPDKTLFDITKKGGQHNASPGFVSRMPGFENIMSDKEIHAVLAYIKSRWPAEIRERQAGINSRAR